MANKLFWIKERDNPQLGTYFVPCGQLSKPAAKKHENSSYGSNIMHCFDDEQSYNAKIKQLRESGERVN
jgi:hypothetical protein